MSISRRIGSIERRLGMDAAPPKPKDEELVVGFLMRARDGELTDARTGDRLTREQAEARFPVLHIMPDNGRDPDLVDQGRGITSTERDR